MGCCGRASHLAPAPLLHPRGDQAWPAAAGAPPPPPGGSGAATLPAGPRCMSRHTDRTIRRGERRGVAPRSRTPSPPPPSAFAALSLAVIPPTWWAVFSTLPTRHPPPFAGRSPSRARSSVVTPPYSPARLRAGMAALPRPRQQDGRLDCGLSPLRRRGGGDAAWRLPPLRAGGGTAAQALSEAPAAAAPDSRAGAIRSPAERGGWGGDGRRVTPLWVRGAPTADGGTWQLLSTRSGHAPPRVPIVAPLGGWGVARAAGPATARPFAHPETIGICGVRWSRPMCPCAGPRIHKTPRTALRGRLGECTAGVLYVDCIPSVCLPCHPHPPQNPAPLDPLSPSVFSPNTAVH